MYNIILIDKPCPTCGNKNLEWQTKDLVIDDIYPIANLLSEYMVNKRMDGPVFTICDECKYWIEADIQKGKIVNEKIGKLSKVNKLK